MDPAKQTRVARFGMVASIAAALGASLCCIGPLVAVTFGMASLAGLAKYESLRPLFGAATATLLAVAFYATYKRPTQLECEPGSMCATEGPERSSRMNRLAVWLATIVAVVVFTFPTWSAWVLG